jgi:hypothetical protein
MDLLKLGEHAPTSEAALQQAVYAEAQAEGVNAAEATQAEHATLLAQAPEANSASTTPSGTNQAQLIAPRTTTTLLCAPSNAALDCALTIADDPDFSAASFSDHELLRTVAWMQLVALLIRLHIIDPSTPLTTAPLTTTACTSSCSLFRR